MYDHEYDITAIENGFLLKHSYKEPTKSADVADTFDYKYSRKSYMFADWNGVMEWVNNNPLSFPPSV